MTGALRNRLDAEISPYLLAHADNPVAWQPWDEQALAAARELDRPILLSIGYSACHWCHVMAHESFEDPDTAAVLNRTCVNIKVDREERPDLDRVHQLAHQALTGRGGGWPLTVFLTPDDRMPFFAGTYFPARPMHGMPSFVDLLARIEAAWAGQRDAIRRQNRELERLLASLDRDGAPRALTRAPLDGAVAALERAFDAEHGGFGDAPKFPQPGALALALERSAQPPPEGERARGIAETTLAAMAAGGIHDQVGGGFARYSVDARWEIPHFEKMLYDNGLLLGLYADAAVACDRPDFAAVARGIAEWALAEMRLPEGGFCASLDADSPGGEGRFYTWDRDEVAALLDPEDHALVARRLGLDRAPNFEGRWHPVIAADLETLARELDLDPGAVGARLERARATLYAARCERAWPARDDKVLTAWNALMGEGLAIAGQRLDEPRYVEAALETVDFVRARLWHEGQLFAVWRDGERRQPAFLDDHAALLHALLALLQARWRDADLELARALAEALLARFADPEAGGFHQTAHDHETLPYRPKPLADESVPSANGLAARALGRLGHLLGEPRYLEAARGTLAAAMDHLEREPLGHATLLRALAEQLEPPETVLLRGPADAVAARAQAAAARFRPGRQVFALPPAAGAGLAALPDAPAGGVVARRCRGTQCDLPETDAERIDALLARGPAEN